MSAAVVTDTLRVNSDTVFGEMSTSEPHHRKRDGGKSEPVCSCKQKAKEKLKPKTCPR